MSRGQTTIPRIAHFVYGLSPREEPFHLVHYLALASCRERVGAGEIHVHCGRLPYGFYWELIRPHVHLHHVEPIAIVSRFPYEPLIGRATPTLITPTSSGSTCSRATAASTPTSTRSS